MKTINFFWAMILTLSATAQNVNIPDANFKEYLIENSAINLNGDAEIQVSEATAFTGAIYCSDLTISDLTGIEAFVNLTELACNDNVLTSLDVSQNTALTKLFCGYQPLMSLDISTNTSLIDLGCTETPISSIDVSQNTALINLYISNTGITNLDLSQNLALEKLFCYGNALTSLDVSANSSLKWLYCYSNDLACLNVANGNNGNSGINLSRVRAYGNPRLSCIQKDTGYDPTPNSNWQKDASANWNDDCQTTTIGVSTNTVSFGNVTIGSTVTKEVIISNLSCSDLSISNFVFSGSSSFTHNGINNTTITAGETYTFTVTFIASNTSLETGTIEIVNNSSTPNQTINIDGTGTNDCIVYIPDSNFKNYLLSNTSINTVNDSEIDCTEAQNFTGEIDCSGMSISNLTGIEAFTNLTQLRCQANNLTSIDLSQNTALTQLRCYSNQLTTLDLSQNTALTYLHCSSNNLNNLDLSQNIVLRDLHCSINNLTSLDVSNNVDLRFFYCSNNLLTNIDVSNNTDLIRLECQSNALTNLDISSNTNLFWMQCQNNALTTLDVSSNIDLKWLYCYKNAIPNLDVSNNTTLQRLYCGSNKLSNLDISSNSVLQRFYGMNNRLHTLNVANGNNSNLYNMRAENNPNLDCIQHDTGFDPTTNSNWHKDDSANWGDYCCQVTFGTDAQEHCGSFTWINGVTYTSSDSTSTYTLTNIEGCDSIVALNLTILNPTVSIDSQEHCGSFTWIDGNTYTASDSTSTYTLTNIAGCDSTITLNLTIIDPTVSIDTQEHCESFTWTDGVTYTQDTIGVQDTLVNAAGCDSIVTLNLTIHSAPSVSLTFLNDELIATGADSIEWYFDGNLMPNENNDTLVPLNNGGYYVIGYSENGCSSISNAISVAGLSVEENSWSNFTMFPNPTNGTVEIQSDAMISAIEIINNLGQKVGEFNQNQFDISNLKNGVYFVKVTTEIGTSTKRLIKQ